MVPGAFGANDWQLDGHADTRQFNVRWHGLGPTGRILTEARIRVEITPGPAQGDSLLITLDTLCRVRHNVSPVHISFGRVHSNRPNPDAGASPR